MDTPPLILVVDSDPTTRMVVAEILEDEGFAVTTANDAEGAWRQLEEGAAPSLILLDAMTPPKGLEFRDRQLASRWASIPLVLMGGSSFEVSARLSRGGCALLQKPFAFQELLREVRRLTDPPATPVRSGGVN